MLIFELQENKQIRKSVLKLVFVPQILLAKNRFVKKIVTIFCGDFQLREFEFPACDVILYEKRNFLVFNFSKVNIRALDEFYTKLACRLIHLQLLTTDHLQHGMYSLRSQNITESEIRSY